MFLFRQVFGGHPDDDEIAFLFNANIYFYPFLRVVRGRILPSFFSRCVRVLKFFVYSSFLHYSSNSLSLSLSLSLKRLYRNA